MSARARSAGEGSIYFNENRSRWEGQLDLGRKADGKRLRRKVTGKTRADVAKRLSGLRAEVDAGHSVSNGNTTVGELLEHWATEVLPGQVTARTLENYRWAIDGHLVPGLGSRRLAKLSTLEIEAYLRSEADAGLSRNSLFRCRAVLGQALRWARKHDLVAGNAIEDCDLPVNARPPREGRALEVDEALSLMHACEDHRIGAMWIVQLSLGLRPGEVAGLSWSDVDLDADVPVVHVRSSLRWTDGVPELVAPKTKKSRRTLALPQRAVEALRHHQEASGVERLVLGHDWPAQWSGLVFHSEAGTPLDPHNVRREFRKVTKAAGLGHVRPYDLRHSAATLLATSGVPIEHIANVLGHEGITMARSVYVHVQGQRIGAGLAPMDQILQEPPG